MKFYVTAMLMFVAVALITSGVVGMFEDGRVQLVICMIGILSGWTIYGQMEKSLRGGDK